jgi:hypothetical protein
MQRIANKRLKREAILDWHTATGGDGEDGTTRTTTVKAWRRRWKPIAHANEPGADAVMLQEWYGHDPAMLIGGDASADHIAQRDVWP